MKRTALLFLLLTASILTFGCGSKEEDIWQGEEATGEINEDAEDVDSNDFDEEMEIDAYLDIPSANESSYGYTWDRYRTNYNLLAEQLEMPALTNEYEEMEIPQVEGAVVYVHENEESNSYVCIDPNTKELYGIYVEQEVEFLSEGNNLSETAKLIPSIYAGVPNMKKFDLNRMFTEMSRKLKTENGSYSYQFNGYSIEVSRKSDVAKVLISKIMDNDEEKPDQTDV